MEQCQCETPTNMDMVEDTDLLTWVRAVTLFSLGKSGGSSPT